MCATNGAPRARARGGRRSEFAARGLAGILGLAALSVGAGGVRADDFWSHVFPLGEKTEEPHVPDTPRKLLGAGELPERPALPIEIGDRFLDTGPLYPGFELPGGAVWQPRFWVFGTLRSAIQSFDNGPAPATTEWANRLDVYGNLQLTGTERVVIGLRPFDRNRSGQFSGYRFEPNTTEGWQDFRNGNIQALFLEGDFGSTFPDLDPKGTRVIDFGYTVGRQPLVYQNGMLMNDTVDTVGLVRNSIHVPYSSNMLVTGFYGWNEIDRAGRGIDQPGRGPKLWGLSSSTEILNATYDIDLIRVTDQGRFGDAWYVGGAVIQRFWLVNTALRVNSSIASGPETAVSTDGTLVSLETSFTPFRSEDIVYFNPYVALGNFTQAARDPTAGGPLAGLGITYAAYGIGTSVSPLSNAAREAVGFALGYQAFWDTRRRSLTFEIGVRQDTGGKAFDAQALGIRFQQAIGQRVLLEVDATFSRQENQQDGHGLRAELLYQF